MKTILGLLHVCLLTVALSAQVPNSIAHQGYLTNGSGSPVNGTVELTLSLYSQPELGSPVWTFDTTDVVVENGIFEVYLGPGGTPPMAEVDFTDQLYLGIAVNYGDELVPRTPLKAVPYALEVRSQHVAFMASVSEDIVHPSSPDPVLELVVFDSVHANYGGGYSPTTGVFTVPVAGWYQFNVALKGAPYEPYLHWSALMTVTSNSVHAYFAFTEDNETISDGGGASITVWAGEGDRVSIQSTARAIMGNLPAISISHLSGHLIFASDTPE